MTNKELINIVKQYPIRENGLKFYNTNELHTVIDSIDSIGFNDDYIGFKIMGDYYVGEENELDSKPILNPLSLLLTEEIEHNGERFVPIDKIKEIFIDDNSKSCEIVFRIGLESSSFSSPT